MISRDLASYEELSRLIDVSIDQYKDPIYGSDKEEALGRVWGAYLHRGFFQVIEDNGKIVAWGLCVEQNPVLHSSQKALSQIYYHVDRQIPLMAKYRAMRLFHMMMIEESYRRKLGFCTSNSVLENSNTFNEILSKMGWIKYGSTMVYKTR